MADPTTSRVHYSLDSTLATVNLVEQTAHNFALKAGFHEDELGNISLSAREAAVNAVMHGNKQSPDKKVEFSLEFNNDTLTIRIADQGPGFNPDNIPDPLAPENILRGSGRGVFLIRAFMDELNFRRLDSGTELTLIKHKKPIQATSDK